MTFLCIVNPFGELFLWQLSIYFAELLEYLVPSWSCCLIVRVRMPHRFHLVLKTSVTPPSFLFKAISIRQHNHLFLFFSNHFLFCCFSISLPIYAQLILFFRRKVGLLVHKEARQGSKMWRLPKETPRSEYIFRGCYSEAWTWVLFPVNPLTPKISLVILFTVCHTVLVILVWRIWYWINLYSLNWYFSLFSSLVCLILYWYCKEKFCLGHSWELKG